MSLIGAKSSLSNVRANLGSPEKNPALWDISIALEQMCLALETELSAIRRDQQMILQRLSRLK